MTELITVLIVFVAFTIAPMYVGYNIAVDRNRNAGIALVVTLVWGWVAVLIMYLTLRVRDKKGNLIPLKK